MSHGAGRASDGVTSRGSSVPSPLPPVAWPPPLPALQIEAVELYRVSMPLVAPFRTSFGVQTARDVLLVKVVADGVDGWGECVTPAAPVYSAEYTDGAAQVLTHHLVPRLRAGPIAWQDVAARLAPLRGHPMAKAAVEMAVLDAQLRGAGQPLATYLGASRDRVPSGVSVGIPDGASTAERVDHLREQVAAYADEGYLRIKIKIEPGFDVGPVRALRDTFGASLRLQVDANAAYEPSHLPVLAVLDELGLDLIEQPFAENRLLDHAWLAEQIETPLCLDETLVDALVTRDALDVGACEVVNLKLGRVGGMRESLAVHSLCRRRAVDLWCGGMLETGIGRAVNVALAALPGMTLPGDTSASGRYWRTDLTEPFELVDGHLAVPAGPGIGVSPDPERLDAWLTGHATLDAGG